ncbi:unnamed protein product [Rangifer tarandus platyrhynchus]|uniref:Basic proline-rich protein-like n=1 Tax=Rangifer tarandus platyrhynchus TaxID=3082113 RepID=A0ABN8ZHM4_RANTA|nr:unnamed protein product [Rangifer tarandus platyrhynchus]
MAWPDLAWPGKACVSDKRGQPSRALLSGPGCPVPGARVTPGSAPPPAPKDPPALSTARPGCGPPGGLQVALETRLPRQAGRDWTRPLEEGRSGGHPRPTEKPFGYRLCPRHQKYCVQKRQDKTARTASSASRKRAGEGRLSAEGAWKGRPGTQREAIWKRELPGEEGPGCGGGPLGRAGRVPAVRRGPGGAPFLAAPRVGGFPYRRRRRLCSPGSHRWIPGPFLPGTAPPLDPPFPRGRPADSSEPLENPQLRPEAGAPPRLPLGHAHARPRPRHWLRRAVASLDWSVVARPRPPPRTKTGAGSAHPHRKTPRNLRGWVPRLRAQPHPDLGGLHESQPGGCNNNCG